MDDKKQKKDKNKMTLDQLMKNNNLIPKNADTTNQTSQLAFELFCDAIKAQDLFDLDELEKYALQQELRIKIDFNLKEMV